MYCIWFTVGLETALKARHGSAGTRDALKTRGEGHCGAQFLQAPESTTPPNASRSVPAVASQGYMRGSAHRAVVESRDHPQEK